MRVSDTALFTTLSILASTAFRTSEIFSMDCPLSDERTCNVCNCSLDKRSINCTGRNLMAIPGDMPRDVEDINLSKNQITCVPLQYFENFPNLRYLNISYNKLERPFVLPATLINFYGDHNSIQSADEFFTHCNNLQLVDLEGNKISRLRNRSMKNCSKLSKLNIGYNKLERPFVLPASLITFYGDHNSIQSADEFFTHCNNLQLVDLEENKISRLRNGSMKNCSKLSNLNLKHNNFSRLESTFLDSLYQLKNLKFGYNKNLHTVEEGALSDPCRSLTTLCLQSCPQLKEIPLHFFEGCGKLSHVNIDDCGLTSIHPGTFFPLRALQLLDLSFMNITPLHESTFQGVSNINSLMLSSINLHEIPPKIFYNTSIGSMLDLSGNLLRVLPEDLFSSVHTKHSLTILVLSNNLLETLPKGLMRDLRWLVQLFLNGNHLLKLPARFLHGTAVHSLYLFGNQLSSLTEGLFDDTVQNSTFLNFIQAQNNPMLNLSEEFLISTSPQSKIILSCDNLLLRSSLDREILCVPQMSTISINVSESSKTLMQSLGERGFTCTVDNGLARNTQCVSCKTGTYGDRARRSCVSCPRGGFYQDEVGQYQTAKNTFGCKFCNNGTFVMKGGGNNSLSCEVCPDGTEKTKHAGFRACFCFERYFRRDRFGKCEICPQEGLNCSDDFVRIMPGYFWDWNYTNIDKYRKFVQNLQTFNNYYDPNSTLFDDSLPYVHKCHQSSRCVNDDSIAGNCENGYQGWMCSTCSKGLFEVFGFCHKCPDISIFFTEIAFLSLVVASFCFYVVYKHRREQPGMSRTIIDVTLARGKIVLGFYQVMGEFWKSLDEFQWPEYFKKLAEWLNLLQINISTILIKPSCYFPKLLFTPYVMFVIGVSVPLAIISCITVILFIGKAILRCVAQDYPRRGHIKAIIDRVCDKALTIGLLVLYITYPSTCNVIFALYRPACETFYLDEQKTVNISILRSDYSINCTTSNHSKFVTASYVASAYVVAFPFTLFCLLWKYQRKSPATLRRAEGQPFPKWLRFLNENYKDRYWFWEILELLRKISQTFIIILFGWSSSFSITVTLAISVIFLSMHTSYSPMKDRFEHYLQLSSLWAIFLNMLVATVPQRDVSDNDTTETAMDVLLITLNLLVIGIIIGKPVFFLLKIIQQSRIFQTSKRFMVRLYKKHNVRHLFARWLRLNDSESSGEVLQSLYQNTENYGSIQ